MTGARQTAEGARAQVSDALAAGRQRAGGDPRRPVAGRQAVLTLQRAAGNAAVGALLAARLRSPGEQARSDVDAALKEMRRDEPAVDTVEKGLRAARAVGVPVDLEGPRPPASALAVTTTGFGPGSVPPKAPVPPAKAVPAVSPLGKAAAVATKAGGGPKVAPVAAPGGNAPPVPAPTALSGDQLLLPPVAPAGVRPDDDPAFGQVRRDVKGFAQNKRAHPAAAAKAKEAQDAALAPSDDLTGQAKAAKVDTMDAQPAGTFDKQAFIAAVKAAIEAKSPKTLEEADEYRKSGKAGEVKGDVKGLVTQGKDGQAKDIETATAAPPDTGRALPKPVTPMAEEQPGQTVAIPATGAVPKPAPAEQLNLAAGKHQADQELADAEVTEPQLAQSHEPEFQQALTDKRAAAAHADTAPGEFRRQEQQVLAQGRAEATAQTTAGVAGMQGAKGAAVAALVAGKGKAKSRDEAKRAEVTAKIQGIFAATEADTRKLLDGIDPKVDKEFERGEADARTAFETYVAAKMAAFKKDRYGGWLGGFRWAKDKLFGMPAKVDEFYRAGREIYLRRMDGVISRVATIVGTDLTAAKQRIARGRTEISGYVESLPKDLKKVGSEATKEIGDRFTQLESDVDAKQESVVDTLATKYVDARKGLDERIEALQAENKGLVDKAIGAIKAVINTIRELVAMLKNVLSRAAGVVGDIIKNPIGFLGNLIAGVKGGILKFKENIVDHLRKGLMGWLFGALAEGGVELPETFDVKGVIKLLASIFGLTWANIRNRIVKQIGAPAMEAVEKGVTIFQILAAQGVGGLWQMLLEKLGDIKEMILAQVREFVEDKIITAGITWLIGLLNPAAAFIKACKLIYDVVMFFVSNAGRIARFVETILDSVADIVRGNVSAVVNKINDVLGQMLPIIIGFLASVIGLGGIGQKVRAIVESLKKPVNQALDFVIKTGLKLAGPVIRGIAGISGKVKAKVAAGKAWAKGKVEAGKAAVKAKAAALVGRFRAQFVARRAGGGTEQHTVTSEVGADGRVRTIVASQPTELDVLLGLYRGRLAQLPERAGRSRPRAEALTALNNIDTASRELTQASDPKAKERAVNKEARNLKKLMDLQAEFGEPDRERLAEEPSGGQQMTARITLMVPHGRRPLEMAGPVARGTGELRPRGAGYELLDPDRDLPPETWNKSRVGVYTATNTPNTSGATEQREVVTHGWAAGGKAYRESNTGHTESQFLLFLDRQGEAFRQRIIAIELHSKLSPCSDCTKLLLRIRAMLDRERGPLDPADPAGPKLPRAGLVFFYSELYQPPEKINLPNRQAAQTRPTDINDLKSARWIIHP